MRWKQPTHWAPIVDGTNYVMCAHHILVGCTLHVHIRAIVCTCIIIMGDCMYTNLLFYTGMFYYLLGNIEPKLRSTLKCIQLIACVSVPDMQKYGYEMILKPFISDANKLYEVYYYTYKIGLCCTKLCL